MDWGEIFAFLPTNPDSVAQSIKKVHLQSSTRFQCTSQTIISLSS